MRDSDRTRDGLIAMMEQWKTHLALDQGYTLQQVMSRAIINQDFHNALMAVAQSRSGGGVSNTRLGMWLKSVEGKIINGLKFRQDGKSYGFSVWKLVRN